MSFAIQSSHFYVQPNAEIAKQTQEGPQENTIPTQQPSITETSDESTAFASLKATGGNIALCVKETNTAMEDYY
tara:strand:- start:174 stop:395 length:222 start_codon:yes stop_codon:yes gene_type:complete